MTITNKHIGWILLMSTIMTLLFFGVKHLTEHTSTGACILCLIILSLMTAVGAITTGYSLVYASKLIRGDVEFKIKLW